MTIEEIKDMIRAQALPEEKIMRVVGPNADRHPGKDFDNTDCYGVNFIRKLEVPGRPSIIYWKKRYWIDKADGHIVYAETNWDNNGWIKI